MQQTVIRRHCSLRRERDIGGHLPRSSGYAGMHCPQIGAHRLCVLRRRGGIARLDLRQLRLQA